MSNVPFQTFSTTTLLTHSQGIPKALKAKNQKSLEEAHQQGHHLPATRSQQLPTHALHRVDVLFL